MSTLDFKIFETLSKGNHAKHAAYGKALSNVHRSVVGGDDCLLVEMGVMMNGEEETYRPGASQWDAEHSGHAGEIDQKPKNGENW